MIFNLINLFVYVQTRSP